MALYPYMFCDLALHGKNIHEYTVYVFVSIKVHSGDVRTLPSHCQLVSQQCGFDHWVMCPVPGTS